MCKIAGGLQTTPGRDFSARAPGFCGGAGPSNCNRASETRAARRESLILAGPSQGRAQRPAAEVIQGDDALDYAADPRFWLIRHPRAYGDRILPSPTPRRRGRRCPRPTANLRAAHHTSTVEPHCPNRVTSSRLTRAHSSYVSTVDFAPASCVRSGKDLSAEKAPPIS